MAVGTIVLSSATVLEVSPDGVVAAEPVSDIHTITKGSSRTLEQFPVFMRSSAHSVPGAREVTLSMNGYLSKGDTGQDLLRSSEEADDTVFQTILPDGTNGIIQEFRVGSRDWEANAEGGLQGVSFEMGAAGDPVVEGSGLTF